VATNETEGISDYQSWRYRINVSTSVKGVHTFDSTVEAVGADNSKETLQEVLERSDALVAALNKRYPPAGGV